MKKALKIFLAVLLIVTALISILAALSSLIALGYGIYSAIAKITNFSYSFFPILSSVIDFTSVCMSAAFFLLFVIIAIGCIIGTIYLFIGSNDSNRIARLEAVIDEAYATSDEVKDGINTLEQADAPLDAKEEAYE